LDTAVQPKDWPNDWMVAGRSSDLGDYPMPSYVHGYPLVLFRANGGIAALEDACSHRYYPLSDGWCYEGSVICPYHGWRFGADGSCVEIPGLNDPELLKQYGRGVPVVASTDAHGLLWVAGKPDDAGAPYRSAVASKPGWHGFVWKTEVSGNLIDMTKGFLRKFLDRFGKVKPLAITRRIVRPGLAELVFRSHRGAAMVITAHLTPYEADRVAVHAVVSFPGGPEAARRRHKAVKPRLNEALRLRKRILPKREHVRMFGRHVYYTVVPPKD
jgi:nitrite reductase/ring-hydroxylating ferredoxin subunit